MKEPVTKEPITLYYSYSGTTRDRELLKQLEKHLTMLKRSGEIQSWYRDLTRAGHDKEKTAMQQLAKADIVLPLLSSDYFASTDYDEIGQALALPHKPQIVPILLQSVDYKDTPLESLQAFPRYGHPISSYTHKDDAFVEIARELKILADQLRQEKQAEQADRQALSAPEQQRPSAEKPSAPQQEGSTTTTIGGNSQGSANGNNNIIYNNFYGTPPASPDQKS